MNLYVVIAIVAALGASHWFAYDTGKDVQAATQLSQVAIAKAAAEAVKDDVSALGHTLAGEVQKGFKGIAVTNRTVVQNIYQEKEEQRVLTDPNCSYPVSTLRVRNDARYDPDSDRRAGQRPDAGVRKPAPAANGQPAPSR